MKFPTLMSNYDGTSNWNPTSSGPVPGNASVNPGKTKLIVSSLQSVIKTVLLSNCYLEEANPYIVN
jgi:hypothetical protein